MVLERVGDGAVREADGEKSRKEFVLNHRTENFDLGGGREGTYGVM